ncbi:MAG: TetR/AcrR family transcriptional regulator [Anaerovoracaceae bacterium]|jgi:AcrR family transcriptional regulator
MAISRREANKIKCRQNILKASRRLFNSKGYEETMIDDIAEMAEISKATFYNYFPNKESLLQGTAEHELEQIRNFMDNELGDVENSDEKLRRVIEFLVLDAMPYINLSRRLTYLNSIKDSPMYAVRVGISDIFKQLIAEGMKQGCYSDGYTIDEIEDAYMSVYLVTQFQWLNIESYSEDKLRRKLHRMFDIATAGFIKK